MNVWQTIERNLSALRYGESVLAPLLGPRGQGADSQEPADEEAIVLAANASPEVLWVVLWMRANGITRQDRAMSLQSLGDRLAELDGAHCERRWLSESASRVQAFDSRSGSGSWLSPMGMRIAAVAGSVYDIRQAAGMIPPGWGKPTPPVRARVRSVGKS